MLKSRTKFSDLDAFHRHGPIAYIGTMTAPYTRIEVRPMAGALGADIHGVDLAQPLDDATSAEIERAFHDRLVLFFHDQRLTPEQHVAFSRRLGPLTRSPYIKHMDEYPDIIAVLKEADERNISTFGNAWHSDFSFLEEPPLGSVLYAREVPCHGGDTLFANMYSAYEALSEGMRRMLDGLNAMHSGRPYGVGGLPADLRVSRSIGIERNRPEADREMAHPVVRVHPGDGPQGAVRQLDLHHALRGHDRGREPAAAQVPLRPRHPARIHLPPALAHQRPGDLGQPLRHALRRQRL